MHKITCSKCNQTLEETTLGPCSRCGGSNRTIAVEITEKVTARDGLGLKAKRPGEKRPYIEDLSIPEHNRCLDKLVHRARVIDRDNDHYFEKITDYETGETIHYCEEPLSQHQNHGSAKKRSD